MNTPLLGRRSIRTFTVRLHVLGCTVPCKCEPFLIDCTSTWFAPLGVLWYFYCTYSCIYRYQLVFAKKILSVLIVKKYEDRQPTERMRAAGAIATTATHGPSKPPCVPGDPPHLAGRPPGGRHQRPPQRGSAPQKRPPYSPHRTQRHHRA